MDRILLLPYGVVGERGWGHRDGAPRGHGADAAGRRDVRPRPDHVSHRGQEGLRGHGGLQFCGEQYLRCYRRVSPFYS